MIRSDEYLEDKAEAGILGYSLGTLWVLLGGIDVWLVGCRNATFRCEICDSETLTWHFFLPNQQASWAKLGKLGHIRVAVLGEFVTCRAEVTAAVLRLAGAV